MFKEKFFNDASRNTAIYASNISAILVYNQ